VAAGANNGNTRWQTIAAIITVAVLGSGAIVQFGSLRSTVERLETDLTDFRNIQRAQGDEIARLQKSIGELHLSLSEIETQFCASDIVRNLMHANDLRQVSLLWQKVFNVPYPTNNAYYPTICNRHDTTNP
jgi:hypothetical protein